MPYKTRRGSAGDFLEDWHIVKDRVRRLELRPQGGAAEPGIADVRHYENWIVSPPTIRPYPVGFVSTGEIIGFRWSVPVGFIVPQFYHNGSLIYSAGTVGGVGSFMLATPVAVTDGDRINPQITGIFSNPTDATMSFLLRVT